MTAGREWWRGAVIYQIYPRSFSDSNGDGIGDLRGIADRLEHIAGLGVDAIWIAPFFASPMKDFGYDVADYCAVDPVFGTLADFDAVLARAHALGLKVIIDQVWSHTADQHAWFADSRARRDSTRSDWYVWADPRPDGTPPNNWLSVFGGSAWTWEPRRRQYYLHHFLPSQPSLNLRNPAVWQALFGVASFWLDRGVDGFRLDAIDFMMHDPALPDNPACPPVDGKPPLKPFRLQRHDHDMMQQPEILEALAGIRRLIDRYPGRVTLGEVSSEPGSVERCGIYTGGDGRHLHMAYTLGLLKREFSGAFVHRAIAEAERADREGWLCWAFGNHDVERVVSRWSGERPSAAFARLLAALQLSLRGSLCLYQGEELGLPEATLAHHELRDPYGIAFYPEFVGRDGCRTPMPWRADAPHAGFTTGTPWLPVPESHRALAVDRQDGDPASVLAAWRGLLAWRKRHPALVHGDLRLIDVPEPLVAFTRATRGERLLAVFNLSDRSVALPSGLLGADWRPLHDHGFDHAAADDGVRLPPYGALFAVDAAHQAAAARVLEPAE